MPPKIIRDFNPRSREGSDCKSSKLMFSFSNFNPRSREGSDIIGLDYVPFPIGISIHAPARGATIYLVMILFGKKISIHAPARGATRYIQPVNRADRHFNPRSREGSDTTAPNPNNQTSDDFNPRSREGSDGKTRYVMEKYGYISIHAPARGATANTHKQLI